MSGRILSKTRNLMVIVGAALLVLFSALPVKAGDVDSAKQQLEKVKYDVENSSWNSLEDDVKATESFLDGLPDADRKPIQQQLDDLKSKAAAGFKEHKTKEVVDSSKRELDEVADSMGSGPAGAKDMLDRVTARITSDDAKKYVDPDQLAKLQARVNSLQAMVVTKYLDQLAPIIKELDDTMASQPFKDAKTDEDVTHVQQSLGQLKSRINGGLENVPANDPRLLAIKQKIAGYDKTIDAAVGSAGAAQAAENLAHQWEAQKEYFTGWDQEKEGPTWEQYTHISSEAMSDLNMPKTIELLSRVGSWLAEDSVKTVATQNKDNASVKATMADANQMFDSASSKLNANFNKLVTQAEAVSAPKNQDREAIDRLSSRADYFFKGTSYHDANVTRSKALLDKWNNAVANAASAKQAAFEKMTADANAAWPGIVANIKSTTGFTPDKLDEFKGKIIHLKGSNRLGYDYQPGEYAYARSINGMAVAGKFTHAVAAAVESARSQIPPDLFPDDDWDVYATVEGPGKIQARTHSEGDVKIDGEKVGTVTSEQHPTVDCAVVRIFALHAGPVAVGSSGVSGSAVTGAPVGTPAETSSSAPGGTTAAVAGFSIAGLLVHLIELAICLGAAALVVMKARPALALPDGAAAAVKLPGNEQMELLGLAFIAIGLVWLIGKLIVGDLLPAGCLTLCGMLLAGDWFASRKLLPPNLLVSVKSLALPIAAGTVLFGVMHLFLSHWYLF